MRKSICVILTLFLASSAAFAGYQIYREYTERQESVDTYTDLENLISFPEALPEEEPDETNPSESGETEPAPVGPTIDFAALKEINENCVAWIYIEDTAINYPVVQGSDNSYYLKHLIDGKWNSAGCIFLDSRVYNGNNKEETVSLEALENSSTLFSSGAPKETTIFGRRLSFLFVLFTFLFSFFSLLSNCRFRRKDKREKRREKREEKR